MRRLRLPPPAVVLLAVLAYLPALTAAPGRMPSDSKLYLYLDPQRLVSDGFHNFDPRQFAGWVPHQHIAYLWPSGPWFSVFEIVGVPDWLAHRLWIGTLVFLAGLGVRWVADLLGLSAAGALAAAVVYQCSPYLLPYVSRTSVMLLPWAGLGWIVGLTMLATLRSRWRHAAALAVVVFTVGAVNATALVMIVPAPALWLLHAATSETASWRRVGRTALTVSALCVAVSIWWAVALVLQGRHGSDVLAFSETLEAVSFTSLSTEVMRGLGYWLFYVRDPFGATTTAAIDHLASGRTIAVGLALVLVCLAGLALTRWSQRRYAVWLVVVGVVLAVGVHPIDRPSPLMSLLTGDGESGLALALRSSTRAVPVSLLGLALGAGALVAALRQHRWRRPRDVERAAAAAVVLLAVVGLPALWTGGFVDPLLERDQDPPRAWLDAVDDLDARADGHRVLQLPGAEFGSFRWGHTVDQPIPGLSDTPLVTRDLLPLGSPAAMDLLYALDDRAQRGTLELRSVAPVARLLGVRTVWLANDLAYDRYRTPRPDRFARLFDGTEGATGVDGLADRRGHGEPVPNVATVPMLDEQAVLFGSTPEALPPVELVDVTDPVPVLRAKSTAVLIAGNGDGVVDAAASGLLDGSEAVRYAAGLGDATGDGSRIDRVVMTDTDRPRARHWRSSQDTVGFTEDGTDRPALLRAADGDARLELFDQDPRPRTVAEQVGSVTARVTSYGEPFAYRSEHRAVMAIDGDAATAWRVADRFDAVGERIELELAEAPRHLTVIQASAPDGARRIAEIDVRLDDGPPERIVLDERSHLHPGQELSVAGLTQARTISIAIAATTAAPGHPEAGGSVGFAEIDVGLGPTREVVRLAALDSAIEPELVPAGTPVDVVLTRERVRPTDRWRSDPEPHLDRAFDLPGHSDRTHELELDVVVRLDQRADDALLLDLFGLPADLVSSARLTGSAASAGWSAVDGLAHTAWRSPVGAPSGSSLTVPVRPEAGTTVTIVQPEATTLSVIRGIRVHDDVGGVVEVDLAGPGATDLDLAGLGGSTWTFTVTDVDERVTIDRRYGEPTVLPVAINSLSGPALPTVAPPAALDTGCRDDLLELDGRPLPLRVTGSVEALLAGDPVTAAICGSPVVDLPAGRHTVRSTTGARTGLQVDRVVFRSIVPRTTDRDPVDVDVIERGRTSAVVSVGPCPVGCWMVFGEGYNPAWSASLDGAALGTAQLVDGGFNGWWLDPSEQPRTFTVEWGPQPWLTAALVASALAVIGCVALIVFDRRRRAVPEVDGPEPLSARSLRPEPVDRRDLVVTGAVWILLSALVIDPWWALAPLPVIAVMVGVRSVRPAGLFALGLAAIGAAVIISRVVRFRPAPDAAWVLSFDDLHRPGLLVVTALVASLVWRNARARRS